MNAVVKKQSRKIFIKDQKVECQIIEFPISESKKQEELKVPSMSCCKTSMMDWDFSRGF